MKKIFPVLIITALTLTACVSREDADAKLARGCAAGATVLMTDGFELKETKSQTFRESPEFGTDYREVTLSILESDGWTNTDKDVVCVFSEGFGFLGLTGYAATLYQLKKDGQVYGQQGNEVLGSVEDILKLNDAVNQAIR